MEKTRGKDDVMDGIILLVSVYILALTVVNYFNLQGFGMESALSIIAALIVALIHQKDKNK